MPARPSSAPERSGGRARAALVSTLALVALLGLVATAGLVVLRDLEGGEKPPVRTSGPGGTGAVRTSPASAQALVARAAQSATRLITGNHADRGAALAAWNAFAADLVAARQGAQPSDVSTAVALSVATAVSSAAGRTALAATEAALDGEVLTLPEGRAEATKRADRAARAAGTTPRVRVYFVNGVLNDLVSATDAAASVGSALGVHVDLAYNRSVLQTEQYAVDLCMRGVVAGYRDRAGVGDYGDTTVDSLMTGVGRDLQAAGDAALTVACTVADSVLSSANLAGRTVLQLLRSGSELTLQWLADSRVVSATVNQKLERKVKAYLGRGDRVLLIGHSQGTMFVRHAQQDLSTWWRTALADGDIAGCAPTPSATPSGPAPVAALYLSPAFWARQADSSDLQSGLQRYVALEGDVLGTTKVGWVKPTVEPMDRQLFSLPGSAALYPAGTVAGVAVLNSFVLHLLATYLMDDSSPTTSRRQVIERYGQLRDALRGLEPPAGCATGTTGPRASGTAGDSSWVVWRALEPFAGVGVNVTTTEIFDTPQVASRYSGGGLDPTATFEKELLLDQEFGSREEAMAALCAGLSDVRMWPLGAGMHGVWQGTTYPLGDSVECPQE